MADNLQVSVSGLSELVDRLHGFPIAMKEKGIRYGARRAANIIQQAAVANALRIDDPATGEQIAKNIVVRFSNRTFKTTGNVMFRVGVLGGARQYADSKENRRANRAGKTYATAGDKSNPGGDTWYWRLVEFGTATVPARPILRPALKQNTDRAIAEFIKSTNQWLDRNFKKIKRNGI